MYKYISIALLVASAMAVPTPDSGTVNLDCTQHEDTFGCMAIKAVNLLDRAARSADLKIVDGVTFVRDTPMERSGKSLKTETELMNELPQDTTDRALQLVSMLYESALSFFKSHSLNVKIPEGSVSRALVEGRGKIKKVILPLIAAVGVKLFALVPMLLGSLALLVVKAVFVSKIALLIAAILGFQRLFSGGSYSGISNGFGGNIFGKNPQGSWYDGNQGWSSGSSSQSQGYYRSFGDQADAHALAYSAQAPSSNEAN